LFEQTIFWSWTHRSTQLIEICPVRLSPSQSDRMSRTGGCALVTTGFFPTCVSVFSRKVEASLPGPCPGGPTCYSKFSTHATFDPIHGPTAERRSPVFPPRCHSCRRSSAPAAAGGSGRFPASADPHHLDGTQTRTTGTTTARHPLPTVWRSTLLSNFPPPPPPLSCRLLLRLCPVCEQACPCRAAALAAAHDRRLSQAPWRSLFRHAHLLVVVATLEGLAHVPAFPHMPAAAAVAVAAAAAAAAAAAVADGFKTGGATGAPSTPFPRRRPAPLIASTAGGACVTAAVTAIRAVARSSHRLPPTVGGARYKLRRLRRRMDVSPLLPAARACACGDGRCSGGMACLPLRSAGGWHASVAARGRGGGRRGSAIPGLAAAAAVARRGSPPRLRGQWPRAAVGDVADARLALTAPSGLRFRGRGPVGSGGRIRESWRLPLCSGSGRGVWPPATSL